MSRLLLPINNVTRAATQIARSMLLREQCYATPGPQSRRIAALEGVCHQEIQLA